MNYVTASAKRSNTGLGVTVLSAIVAAAAISACSSAGGGNRAFGGFGGGGGTMMGTGGTVIGAGGSLGGGPSVGGAGGGVGGGAIGTDSGTGGNPLADGGECFGLAQQAENTVRPVDIIWAVDGSPSMGGVINTVNQRMNDMANTVTSAGIDVRIVMIAEGGRVCVQPPVGGPGCTSNAPQYTYLTACPDNCWVGSHNALGRLTGAFPYYKDVIRPNSVKYFGAVTDDTADDTHNYQTAVDAFMNRLGMLDQTYFDSWKFFGILRMPSGTAYKMLADMTGGTWADLSDVAGWSNVFTNLATTITDSTTLDCEWEIPPTPPGETFAPDLVNVNVTSGAGVLTELKKVGDSGLDCAVVQEGGWYYDNEAAPTKVQVCPQTCANIQSDLNAKVDVLFGCRTIVVPK